jgi:hypothetical protein
LLVSLIWEIGRRGFAVKRSSAERRSYKMIRNLKTLGLALVAVFAMSAMAASAAQALVVDHAQITFGTSSPGVLDGTQTTTLVFTREGRTFTCTTANFHAEVNAGDTTITVTPTYSGCHSNIPLIGVLPATVTMNGCDWVFHLTKHTPSGTFTGDPTLVCQGTNQVEVHVYSNHADHTSNTSLCTTKYSSQTPSGTIDLTNKAAGGSTPDNWIELDINLTGISSTMVPSGVVCGMANNATGTWAGNVSLKATTAAGASQGLTVSTDVETP